MSTLDEKTIQMLYSKWLQQKGIENTTYDSYTQQERNQLKNQFIDYINTELNKHFFCKDTWIQNFLTRFTRRE